MRTLREKDIGILAVLAEHPVEGLYLGRISLITHDTSVPNTHARISKLVKRGYITAPERGLYKITDEGAAILKEMQTIAISHTQPLISSKPATAQNEGTPPTSANKEQRAHAFRTHTRIYRTSYDKVEAILQSLNIPYKKTSLVPAQYIIAWKGLKIRISTRKATIWGRQREGPIELTDRQMTDPIFKECVAVLEDFLRTTSIRAQRDIYGRLLMHTPHWEIAFTDNELARRATEKGGFITIAFDRLTGEGTLWFDESFTAEMETNRSALHRELRSWGQGLQDGIIHPYDDEMAHRKQEADLWNMMDKYVKNIDAHATFIYERLKDFSDRLDGNPPLKRRKPDKDDQQQRRLR